ncbi:MAG: hypothetical protein Q9162_007213 [Coniocarpon cinnabarinum]
MTIVRAEPERIDLFKGYPSPSLLPSSLLSESSARILSNPNVSTPALLYGADEGYKPLRDRLAKWLDQFYGTARRLYASSLGYEVVRDFEEEAEIARLTITGGASQSLSVILSTFTDPDYTQAVYISVPAYYLSFKIFQDAGFAGRLKPVPEDDEGVNVDHLRNELLKSHDASTLAGGFASEWRGHKPRSIYEKVYRQVIYVVPTFANPSSRTMSLRRREELVRVAREFDALVVCDDVYDFLQWRREPSARSPSILDSDVAQLPRVVDIDRHLHPPPNTESFGNVISNGSFSKILGPGIRTGWVDASPALAHRLSQTGCQKSGGAPSQYAAVCISDMIESGALQRHVQHNLKPAYERRWQLMRRAVRNTLEPLGVTVIEQKPEEGSAEMAGGYFIWITLPEPLEAMEIAREAGKLGLVLATGAMFQVPELIESSTTPRDTHKAVYEGKQEDVQAPASRFPRSVRLCFSYADETLLAEGIKRLATVIEDVKIHQKR